MKCSGCQLTILSGEVITSSGLLGSKGCDLCPACAKYEEDMIDKEGTNDIPDLLATYSSSVEA